jgi:diguanylate cyclase
MVDNAADLDFEYAVSVADKAMRLMLQYEVPPTPNNFKVWFAYSLGSSRELKRAMEILIGNKKKFDTATNRELFSTFLDSVASEQAIGDVSQRLNSVMSDAKRFLATAIADNRSQIQAIGNVTVRAQGGADPNYLIKSLMTELELAATRASKMEDNFTQTSQQLEAIRESLSESEQRAKTDALTGLPNRRALDEFSRAAQTATMETGEPLSILLLDVDHFKKFNDGFGHAVGDEVLRLIAKTLKDHVRAVDLPARYGGEELIAILPGADLATCADIAERVRRKISECRITRRSTGTQLPKVTVSLGVAQFRPGESMAELIERSDRALYHAKRTGRDRVVTEQELDGDLAVA